MPLDKVFTSGAPDGILCSAMRENPSARCALCSTEIAQGTRAVYVTVENEAGERVYHLDCFAASTTGSFREGAVWTYRIVGTLPEAER